MGKHPHPHASEMRSLKREHLSKKTINKSRKRAISNRKRTDGRNVQYITKQTAPYDTTLHESVKDDKGVVSMKTRQVRITPKPIKKVIRHR